MQTENSVQFVIRDWAAWAPGVADKAAWKEWAKGCRAIGGIDEPDVGFVEPLLRRRLSRLSRMAFKVARDCSDDSFPPQALVFCSRYGEYQRTIDILTGLNDGQPVSAAAFSTSVHNTASSLYAIHCEHRGPITVVSGNDATLETACLHAGSILITETVNSVLVVYHDEPLPSIYTSQPTSVHKSLAFALLLQSSGDTDEGIQVRLSCDCRDIDAPFNEDPVLSVVRLCLGQSKEVAVNTDRVSWLWRKQSAVA